MEGQKQQDVAQQAGLSGGRQRGRGLQWRKRGTGRGLGHLAVNARPTLVALAGELVLHVQDVVVVEVATDVEAGPLRGRVPVDVEVARVQVQVRSRVQALTHAPAVLLAERFAAQLGGGGDVDDVMSQRTVDVLLHRQAVPLEEEAGFKEDTIMGLET